MFNCAPCSRLSAVHFFLEFIALRSHNRLRAFGPHHLVSGLAPAICVPWHTQGNPKPHSDYAKRKLSYQFTRRPLQLDTASCCAWPGPVSVSVPVSVAVPVPVSVPVHRVCVGAGCCAGALAGVCVWYCACVWGMSCAWSFAALCPGA